jgi:hypothetical protein
MMMLAFCEIERNMGEVVIALFHCVIPEFTWKD